MEVSVKELSPTIEQEITIEKIVDRYVSLQRKIKKLQDEQAELKNELKKHKGLQKGRLHAVEIKKECYETFDKEKFIKEYGEEVYNEFKTKRTRTVIRVKY